MKCTLNYYKKRNRALQWRKLEIEIEHPSFVLPLIPCSLKQPTSPLSTWDYSHRDNDNVLPTSQHWCEA